MQVALGIIYFEKCPFLVKSSVKRCLEETLLSWYHTQR